MRKNVLQFYPFGSPQKKEDAVGLQHLLRRYPIWAVASFIIVLTILVFASTKRGHSQRTLERSTQDVNVITVSYEEWQNLTQEKRHYANIASGFLTENALRMKGPTEPADGDLLLRAKQSMMSHEMCDHQQVIARIISS